MQTRRHSSSLPPLLAAALWTATLVTAGSPQPMVAQAKADAPDLSAVRAALKKYQDPYLAIHDGYFSTLGCVEIGQAGAAGHVPYQPGGMGIHFINLGQVGPVPDPARPQVLIYEPAGDKLRLVAAEWFVPLATGVKTRPTLWGQAFDGPMMGHPPLTPMDLTHYDLHVWLYKSNPLGMFASTNPTVSCAGHPYRLVEEAPMLVSPTAP